MLLLRPVPLLTLLAAFLVVDAHVLTLFIPGWGIGTREYTATFLALTALALAARRMLLRRRIASLTLALTGVMVLASSAALLFAAGTVRRLDVLEWLTFWHAAWSWAFGLALVAHFTRNAPRFRQLARVVPSRVVTLAWGGLFALAAVTAAAPAWRALPRDGHAERVLVVTGVLVAVAGVAWARAGRGRALRQKPRRALVDVNLLASTTLAFASGVLVLYADDALDARGLGAASVFWHSVTSSVLVALAFVHALANARALRAHARGVARESTREAWRAR